MTRRDFLQAAALGPCMTSLALRAANEQLAGRLGEVALRLREDLLGVIAHVEAYIDFPEEDIDPDTGAALRGRKCHQPGHFACQPIRG